MRLVVGFLGVLLPVLFIIGEWGYLRGGVHVRGSLSAYYHTAMQDIFVGGLCVIGFLLMTYMAGELRSWDFWASLIAGIAVLGVVFLPTSRFGLAPDAPPCGNQPEPAGCSFVQQALGEHRTAVIHGSCAMAFILGLAVMSFLFASSEVLSREERNAGSEPGRERLFRRPALFWIHTALAIVILLAGAWALIGGALRADVGELTPLYVGEVAAVWSFGASWLLAGFKLTAPARPGPAAPVTPTGETPTSTDTARGVPARAGG
jgi:hypothetical protein